jgi:apolipoprotein N-acyltransferase
MSLTRYRALKCEAFAWCFDDSLVAAFHPEKNNSSGGHVTPATPHKALATLQRDVSRLALVGSLIVSAFLMALAVASPAYWWLGWVALLPFFFAIRTCSSLGAMWCGSLWGVSLFVFGVAVPDSQLAPTFSSLFTLVGIPAAYAFVATRLTQRVGFSPLLLALGWMGVEFALRPVGLKHGLLASTQDGGVFWSAFGSFAGYVLVAFAVAYVNASLVSVLSQIPRIVGVDGGVVLRGASGQRKPVVVDEISVHLRDLLSRSQPRAPPL